MREALGGTRISRETALSTLPGTLCCPVIRVSPVVSAVMVQTPPGRVRPHPAVWLQGQPPEHSKDLAERRQQWPGASLQKAGGHSSPSHNDESQVQRSVLLKTNP